MSMWRDAENMSRLKGKLVGCLLAFLFRPSASRSGRVTLQIPRTLIALRQGAPLPTRGNISGTTRGTVALRT